MKIMVVGGGGREHTIIKKLKENKKITQIFALPGNGGMAKDAICVNIGATDLDGIVAFAKENAIDYAVVAPDDPLVLGCVDRLNEIGIPCFGPNAKAAIIEGSKAFSKDLMKKYNIPTAAYENFDDADEAIKYLGDKTAKQDELRIRAVGALMRYMEDKRAKEDKIFDDPSLMRTPIVRNGKEATVGFCPDIWKTWE